MLNISKYINANCFTRLKTNVSLLFVYAFIVVNVIQIYIQFGFSCARKLKTDNHIQVCFPRRDCVLKM